MINGAHVVVYSKDAEADRGESELLELGFDRGALFGGGDKIEADPRLAALGSLSKLVGTKADDKSLAPVPADGYAYVPGADKAPAAISKGIPAATAPKQLAVVWAEYYAVSAEGSRGLLFLRLADAATMRIVASEVAFTEFGATAAPVGTCAVALRDERSFLPRLAESGDWLLGFDRASNPLGSALLAHLSVTQAKVGMTAAPYVIAVAGGGPAAAEGVRAKWRAVTATAPAGTLAFQVSSIPTGADGVDVGQLTLKVVARLADAIYVAEGGARARVPYGVLSVKVSGEAEARREMLEAVAPVMAAYAREIDAEGIMTRINAISS